MIAGGLGGLASLTFVVPAELLKCRAQMTIDSKVNYQREITKITREQGAKGLFRGFWATFWRDVPTWGVYFYVYELIKSK
jgi:hypothetical protein